jgi:ribosomal protein S12 methylthiotransferase
VGCARNLIDSELILGRMAEAGCLVTPDESQARVVVVNTCSFIGAARAESFGAIEERLAAKRAGELDAVVVAGCLVERYKRDLLRQYPDVDLWAEIGDYKQLGAEVARLGSKASGPAYLEAGRLRGDEREGARLLATPGSYAYLRISHGCDHQCSFCAIPVMRGKHRSKSLDAVVA